PAAQAGDDRGEPGPGAKARAGRGGRGRGKRRGLAPAGRARLWRRAGAPGRHAGARRAAARGDRALAAPRMLRTLVGLLRGRLVAVEPALVAQVSRNEAIRVALAQRELFQRSLLEAAQVAIMALDHEGHWNVFNPAAERLLGWRAEEILGRPVRYGAPRPGDAPLVLTPRQAGGTTEWLREKLGRHVPDDWRALYALADLRQPPTETTLRHRDGHEVPVLLALSAFDDAKGQPAGMIAVAADLSPI